MPEVQNCSYPYGIGLAARGLMSNAVSVALVCRNRTYKDASP